MKTTKLVMLVMTIAIGPVHPDSQAVVGRR